MLAAARKPPALLVNVTISPRAARARTACRKPRRRSRLNGPTPLPARAEGASTAEAGGGGGGSGGGNEDGSGGGGGDDEAAYESLCKAGCRGGALDVAPNRPAGRTCTGAGGGGSESHQHKT